MKTAPLTTEKLVELLGPLFSTRRDREGYYFVFLDADVSDELEEAAYAINEYFKGDQNETAPQPEATPDDRL